MADAQSYRLGVRRGEHDVGAHGHTKSAFEHCFATGWATTCGL